MGTARAQPGFAYAVPLKDGRFGCVVVARQGAGRNRGVLLGYLFGPPHSGPEKWAAAPPTSPGDAVTAVIFGHLGIRDGTWPEVGAVPHWRPEDWPMPVFVRCEEVSQRCFEVYYDPDDPSVVLQENELPLGAAATGPTDSMMGHRFVQARLSRLLGVTD